MFSSSNSSSTNIDDDNRSNHEEEEEDNSMLTEMENEFNKFKQTLLNDLDQMEDDNFDEIKKKFNDFSKKMENLILKNKSGFKH